MKIEDVVVGGLYRSTATAWNGKSQCFRVTSINRTKGIRVYAEEIDPKSYTKVGPIREIQKRDIVDRPYHRMDQDIWGTWEPVDDFENWVRSCTRKEHERKTAV